MNRREVLTGLAAMAVAQAQEPERMFGMIGKITAVKGQRDALIAVLLAGSADMPGCLSYIVSKDASDEDSIWITEAWDSKASHDASLKLPGVQAAIAKGRPMFGAFGTPVITAPVGGRGLAR